MVPDTHRNSVRQTFREPDEEELPAESGRASSPPRPAAAASGPAPPVAEDAVPFRPVRRPPMAVLQIFDDGRKSAELVRVRQSSFVIGRTDGDLVLGGDPLLSGRHAELLRTCHDGRYAWVLRDLNSTNGSFVRVKSMILKEEMEILVSRNRFRFVAAPPGEAAESAEPPAPYNGRQTMNWEAPVDSPAPDRPFLVELLHTGNGRKFSLRDDAQFIGRDPRQCRIVLAEDETLNRCHAKIFRNAQNRWQLDDCDSVNGVWLRVPEIALGAQSSFLLGEQVFALVIP